MALLIADSEFVFGPTLYGFDLERFLSDHNGFLAQYSEVVGGQSLRGAEIIERIAKEFSIGPRLLLTLIEMHSGWVTQDAPADPFHPLPEPVPGLDASLRMAASGLLKAYYDHRLGGAHTVQLADGQLLSLTELNAGSFAVLSYLSRGQTAAEVAGLGAASRFYLTWTSFFGDPYVFETSASLPKAPAVTLQLPFSAAENWFYVSGPYSPVGPSGPLSAIDFAPPPAETSNCLTSPAWVVAAAPGLVVRSGDGTVVVDLDRDGFEGSGWIHVYRYLSPIERVPAGRRVRAGEPLGHPACEGAAEPPARVGFARRYNGEWVPVSDARQPMLLDGWLAVPGDGPRQGFLIRSGGPVIRASPTKSAALNEVMASAGKP